MRTMSACEGFFAKLGKHPYLKLLVGGLVLSSLIFLFPSLYGEGYSAVNILLKGRTEADWNQVMGNSLFYGHSQLLLLLLPMVVADAEVRLRHPSLLEVSQASSSHAFGT